MAVHKGTELNNVKETWDQNERLRQSGEAAGTDNASTSAAGTSDDLARTIREEAAEYDRANKDERVLDGDRATVNEERARDNSDE